MWDVLGKILSSLRSPPLKKKGAVVVEGGGWEEARKRIERLAGRRNKETTTKKRERDDNARGGTRENTGRAKHQKGKNRKIKCKRHRHNAKEDIKANKKRLL